MLTEHIVQWRFKKVCKGDKSLEDECSGRPLEVDSNQLRASLKLILLQLREKLLKNSTSAILQLLGIWRKLESWENSISGYIMSWPQIKKKLSFWSVVFSYSASQQWTISPSDYDVTNSGFYMTTSDDQLHSWTEKKLQSTSQGQTSTQKRSRSVFDGCLVVCWESDSVQVSES